MKAEAQTSRGESTGAEPIVEKPKPARVKGLSRLTTYIRGKEILILGPGNAGKTKFSQYLQRAALDPEGKREMTYAVTRSPAFVVDFGQKEGLVLRVRRAVDTPGQVGPLQHALLVARRKPHAVIVILDCSSDPLATLRWFCLFCNALDTVLRKVAPVAGKLQEVVVLLNKRDKIEDKEFARLRQAVRKVMERFLLVAWGEERVNSIPIQECILARTGRGTALIDGVIARLTERLLKRQDPQAAAVDPEPDVASPADSPPDASGSSIAIPASGLGQPPAGRRPYSPRPSSKPAPAPSSGPAGRQDPPPAAAGSKPAIVSPPGLRPYSSRSSYKPAPAPSSAPAGQPHSQAAGADPKPVGESSAGSRPYSSRPSSTLAPIPSSGPASGAAATPAVQGPHADASGPKEESKQEESKASGTSSGVVRDTKADSSNKQDAPTDKGQPPSKATFRSRWPSNR